MTTAAMAVGLAVVAQPASPAIAGTYETDWNSGGGSVTIYVGEQVDWNWLRANCDPATDRITFDGALPAGLAVTNISHITGAATETGTFPLSNLWCFNANYGSSAGYDTTTITVLPPLSTAPSLSIINLENAACEFQLDGVIPDTAAPGTAEITLSNGTNTATLSLDGFAANDPISLTLSLIDYSTFTADSHVVAYTPSVANPFACGDTISAVLTYAADAHSPNSSPSVSAAINQPPSQAPTVTVVDGMTQTCEAVVTGTLPANPVPGSVHLTLTNSFIGTVQLDLMDPVATEAFEIRFSMDNAAALVDNPLVASYSSSDQYPFWCDDTITATLSYRELGHATASASASAYVVGIDMVSWGSQPISIAVTNLGGVDCSVAVTVLPIEQWDEYNYLLLRVGDIENENYVSIPLSGFSSQYPFVVVVPLTDMQHTSSPYLEDDVTVHGEFNCGDYATANAEQYFFDQLIISNQPEAQTTFVNCSLGSIRFDYTECIRAPKGYFVDSADATEPTACPAGYSTPGTGADSANDCYRQIAQKLKKYKTVSALKFSGTAVFALPTNSGGDASVTASGRCTARIVNPGGKVSGVKVAVRTAVITATKVRGNCVVTFTAPERGRYAPMTKRVTIRVNKAGR